MPRLNLGMGGATDSAVGMSRSIPKLNLDAGGLSMFLHLERL